MSLILDKQTKMPFCTNCGKKDTRSRKIINNVCSDCTGNKVDNVPELVVNQIDVELPCSPDESLGNLKFSDFATWMKNEFTK